MAHYTGCILFIIVGTGVGFAAFSLLLRRRVSPAEVLPPFDVAPALVVALEHLAGAREASGKLRTELLLFAGFALDDAREAAVSDGERAAIALVTRLLADEAAPYGVSLIDRHWVVSGTAAAESQR